MLELQCDYFISNFCFVLHPFVEGWFGDILNHLVVSMTNQCILNITHAMESHNYTKMSHCHMFLIIL